MPDPTFTPWTTPNAHELHLSPEFLAQIGAYLALNPLPITQVPGFALFTARAAPTIAADQSTASTSPTSLSTAGPTLTSLSNGLYLMLFGASGDIVGGGNPTGYMGIKVNSTEPTSAAALYFDSASRAPGAFIALATLSAGNNTLLARYWTSGTGTVECKNRWLVVLRYANA